MESVPLVQGNADLEGYKSSVELQSPHPVQEDVGIFQTEHSESRVVEVNLTANGKSDDVMSPHPVQEDACIFHAGHSESGVVEMNTTANDKSDEIIRLLIDPRRDLSNPEEETVLSSCVSQEIMSRQVKKTKCLLSVQADLLKRSLVYTIIPINPCRNCSLKFGQVTQLLRKNC